jgi:hypothetical protein
MTDDAVAQPAPRVARLWLVYTALRLVVFIGTAGLGLILGLNGFPLLLLAILVSSIVSLFVLRPQREALIAAQLARREQRAAARQALRARLAEEPPE